MPSALNFHEIVPHLMRPPGGGIPIVSAGKGAAFDLQKKHYELLTGKGNISDQSAVDQAWEQSLEDASLSRAKVALLGVPLDTGAGIRRGAAYGPRAVRGALLARRDYPTLVASGRVVDLGDIYVNPHLLHDEMLNDAQIARSQEAMYPLAPAALRAKLSVSALSQLKQVLAALRSSYPQLKVFVIGGDHSVAWPVTEVMAAAYPGTLGIVQPDAHTDLLSHRLGVKYCFGTWSYHANELLGRGGRLVQLGVRQSGRDKQHWESTTEVKQYWPADINGRPADEVVAEVVAHLRARGVKQVYFSNDIDGTDESEAAATGTPATNGLSSELIVKMIAALGKNFQLVAADIMEVAPDLGRDDNERKATCDLAARYVMACIEEQIR